jgi:hypothetical protein
LLSSTRKTSKTAGFKREMPLSYVFRVVKDGVFVYLARKRGVIVGLDKLFLADSFFLIRRDQLGAAFISF